MLFWYTYTRALPRGAQVASCKEIESFAVNELSDLEKIRSDECLVIFSRYPCVLRRTYTRMFAINEGHLSDIYRISFIIERKSAPFVNINMF